jgi:hypothetical protein
MTLRVYIETSVVSYLTSSPSGDGLKAACQQVTKAWWDTRRTAVEAFASVYVVQEAGRGNPAAAQARLVVLRALPLLVATDEIVSLADSLLLGGGLPIKARLDALHIACAAVHRMDVLLTWNCTHIANPVKLPKIRQLCQQRGYTAPELVTPFELMENAE